MVNAHILRHKYKPHFELPKNSVPGLHKVQYRNWHDGSETSWGLHDATKNSELGIFWTGKQTNCKKYVWKYLW